MLQSVRQYIQIQFPKKWPSVAIALFTLIAVLPGFYLSFEDSEIWGITSSRRLVDDIGSLSSAHFKPLFSALFGLIVHLAPSDWSALVASRWVAIVIAGCGVFFLNLVALESLRTRRTPSLCILILGLFTTLPVFLIHFPKVRSDTIAASVAMIGTYLLLSRPKISSTIYLMTSLLVLSITPKSLDMVIALGLIYWNLSERLKVQKFAWITAPVAGVFLVGMIWGRDPMARVLMVFLDSYQSNPLFSEQHWAHVWTSFVSAPVSHLILLMGLGLSILKIRHHTKTEKSIVIAGAVVFLFLLLHSQKFQFFLASRLPFLALAALPGIFWLLDFLKSKQKNWFVVEPRLPLILTALISITLAVTTLRLERLSMHKMSDQKVVHQELRKFLIRTGALTYWDGIGLFPKMNTLFHYPSPGDRHNRDLIGYAEMSKPSLIIRTSKMDLLEPELFVWLTENYAALSYFISVRIARIDSVYFRPNCEIAIEDLEQLRNSSRLTGKIILLVKTANDSNWNNYPFSLQPIRSRLSDFDKSESIVINNCRNENLIFALSSEQAWNATAPPFNSLLFSYDGRL